MGSLIWETQVEIRKANMLESESNAEGRDGKAPGWMNEMKQHSITASLSDLGHSILSSVPDCGCQTWTYTHWSFITVLAMPTMQAPPTDPKTTLSRFLRRDCVLLKYFLVVVNLSHICTAMEKHRAAWQPAQGCVWNGNLRIAQDPLPRLEWRMWLAGDGVNPEQMVHTQSGHSEEGNRAVVLRYEHRATLEDSYISTDPGALSDDRGCTWAMGLLPRMCSWRLPGNHEGCTWPWNNPLSSTWNLFIFTVSLGTNFPYPGLKSPDYEGCPCIFC